MKCLFLSVLILTIFVFQNSFVNAQTEIRNDITENTTWTKDGSPYILIGSDRQVAEGVTLTIEPGVVVKFFSWSYRFWINGHLEADGNPNPNIDPDYITFTSYKDDAHGGDSNNNGNTDAPASGDWTSLVITETGSATFRSCKFLYGGYYGNPMLQIFADIDTVWNCRFEECDSEGIGAIDHSLMVYNSSFKTGNGVEFLTSTNYQGNPKELILKNNDFEVEYLLVNAGYGDSVKIIIEGNDLTRSPTTYQANVCTIFGRFTGDCYFKSQPDIPFLFSSIDIDEGASLTLPEGTIVKMPENTGMSFNGSLWALGTKDNPIIFTSIYDDSVGGDSNGESTDSNLEPGCWGFLNFYGANDSSRLENVIIKYAGQRDPGLKISNSNVLLKSCVFSDIGSYAIYINDANPEITNSTISGNNKGLYVGSFGSPRIHHNDIMLNKDEYSTSGSGLQVDNLNTETTIAENNYWGSALGPKNYTYNPEGIGDLVIGPVDYEPFENEMVNDALISKPRLKIEKNGLTINCRDTASYSFTDVLWDFGDGNSSTPNSPQHTYSTMGIYEVCFTATSDYGVKVKQCKMVDLSTYSDDIKIPTNGFSVFPNPAVDYLSCNINIQKSQVIKIDLFDISGNMIKNLYKNKFPKGQFQLDFKIDELAAGTYFIHAEFEGKKEIRRFLVR